MLTTTDMLIIFLTFENETYTRYVDTFFTFGKNKICDVALYFHNNSAKLTYETSWRKTSIFTSLDDLTPSDSAKLNKDLNNVTRSVYAKKGVSTKDFEVEFIETLRSGQIHKQLYICDIFFQILFKNLFKSVKHETFKVNKMIFLKMASQTAEL